MLDVAARTSQLVLDTMDLTIFNAWDENDKPLAFATSTPDPALGSVLVIYFTMPLQAGSKHNVTINYQTGPKATGLNWLTTEQTATKKMPYLFSQCEPIYCRSLAPLQDTPSNKQFYSANITVENQFKVFMSAISGKPVAVGKDKMMFPFVMDKVPIASYVLAIAVGNLEYASTGSITGVISEPGTLLDTTKMIYGDKQFGIQNAVERVEAYLTPYIWGNYTLLVLPPTFPYGGMENPLLTFASPTTIMTGDISQTYVATHEIAHSWTGNEVTCRDWSNMWLNEGFTVFEERKITGRQHSGTPDFSQVEMLLGTFDFKNSVANFPKDSSFSSLNPKFHGKNPDGSFSEVPYEKGF